MLVYIFVCLFVRLIDFLMIRILFFKLGKQCTVTIATHKTQIIGNISSYCIVLLEYNYGIQHV